METSKESGEEKMIKEGTRLQQSRGEKSSLQKTSEVKNQEQIRPYKIR